MRYSDEDLITDELLTTFRSSRRWKALVVEHCRPGAVCALCHGERGPIRFDLRARHPLGPSLDHVRPASRCQFAWELWAPSNLQPAHFGCNAGKRDRVETPRCLRGWEW
ncbi:MAG: hypothetical protein HGA44_08530 [Cellulomonadaceae bacterium]|nr:hypothetical protein [Cellulomonadaceae bacterium]